MNTADDFCAGLGAVDDAPALAPPEGIEHWTENLWWIAHDGNTGMGLMMHLGSTRHDFQVVRQTVLLFLPDGHLGVDVSVGGFREVGKVRGATLAMECVRPFREWRVKSNGVTQLATLPALWNHAPRQGPKLPLRFDLRAECVGPVWRAGASDRHSIGQQAWASSHYQQTIRLSGSIEIDGVSHAFDATGARDHSRGPRNMGGWTGHALCSAPFPSGRSFGLMTVFGPDGRTPALRHAYVVRDGVMEHGIARPIPPLSRDLLAPESFAIELEIGRRVETIAVQTRNRGLLSMLAPYDVTPGIYRDDPDAIALSESLARFSWDGETGYGIVERSALAATLPLIG